MIFDKIALFLVILGAINWGSIGLFGFDIVSWIFGSPTSVASRIVFTVIAVCGLWLISLFFRKRKPDRVPE